MQIKQLDKWQQEFILTKGSKVLVSGRQTGKSEAAAYEGSEYIATNAKKTVLVISRTERQAEELFNKCMNYLHEIYPKEIKKGVDKPTKHQVKLKNGSRILCLPTGLSGAGIRGYTIDKLIVDEAQLVDDDVYTAITPMLLTTGGDIVLLGTPRGKTGYFWECYQNKFGHFKVFGVNSEEVIRNRKISKTWPEWRMIGALEHLDREKARMSQKEYAQEYMGKFIEDLMQLFPDDLIKNSCVLKRYPPNLVNTYFLGSDIARMGADESTFEIVQRFSNTNLRQVENIVTRKTLLTDTADKMVYLDRMWDFRKIYIDDAGVGAGVFDMLLRNDRVRRKIEAINNSARSLDRDETRKKRLMKEDLYMNMVALMEKGHLKLLDDEDVIMSLKSVQYEYLMKEGQPTRLRIFGNNTHIVEGLIRAAWCVQDKSLNIWVR